MSILSKASQTFIEGFPNHIREALVAHAQETEYPIESVLEMAIIFFLDMDATDFDNCRTNTPGAMRERIAILERILQSQAIEVPNLTE